jgi:hypothetical protein
MRSQFPFTDYDFWAYISAGFVLLFAVDHAAQTGLMVRPSWTVVEGLFATACAYAVGHLLAGLASAILERRIVRHWLGAPSVTLMGVESGPGWFRRVYPSFYEPLPEETRKEIFAKATKRGVIEPGEALFWAAFDVARSNRTAMDRMSAFLNQYGLCRNLSLTALICAVLLGVTGLWFKRSDDYWWAGAALVLGVGMFLRYLKFYRHYSVEVYTTYAHSK